MRKSKRIYYRILYAFCFIIAGYIVLSLSGSNFYHHEPLIRNLATILCFGITLYAIFIKEIIKLIEKIFPKYKYELA